MKTGADMIGIRAAWNAGNTPPATPIRTASPIPTTSAVPLIQKANAISDVRAHGRRGHAVGRQIHETTDRATTARHVDSRMKVVRMLPR